MTIASEITRLQNAKANIRTAIQGKGVTVPASAKLDAYSGYVNQIQQGDPRGNFLVSTVLRTQKITTLGTSDSVESFGHDMTYVDDNVMILAKPWLLYDYSASGHSGYRAYINAFLLDGSSLDFQVGQAVDGTIPSTAYFVKYDSYRLYKDGNNIHFEICFKEDSGSGSYHTLDLIYNKSNNTRSQEIGWGSAGLLPNTGDMNLYTSSWDGCTSGRNCGPVIARTPVL